MTPAQKIKLMTDAAYEVYGLKESTVDPNVGAALYRMARMRILPPSNNDVANAMHDESLKALGPAFRMEGEDAETLVWNICETMNDALWRAQPSGSKCICGL